jgi:CRISPR-associated protein Csd1
MIINALAQAVEHLNVPLDGYQDQTTPWGLTLSPTGTLVSLIPLEVTGTDGKSHPLRQPVPKVTRASQVAPQVGCDTGIYSLGMGKPLDPSAGPYDPSAAKPRDAACHQAWRSMINDWSASTTPPDPAALVLCAWLDAGKPGLAGALPTDEKDLRSLATGNIAIYVQGQSEPVHLRSSAAVFWQGHVASAKSHHTGLCAACGRERQLVDTFPTGVPRRLVPGAGQATVALTSSNFATSSRELRVTGLASAHICTTCALNSVAALTALASDRRHTWSGDDARTIWWLKSGAAPSIFEFLDTPPPAEDAHRIFDQLRAGIPLPEAGDLDDHYYALSFSGRGPRLIIRTWVDSTLGEVERTLADYFDDSAVACIGQPDRQWQPLWKVAKATGTRRMKGGRAEEEAPHGAHDALVRAALTGSSPPPSLLAAATSRSRAEIGLAQDSYFDWRDREHARACLIRLILNRSSHLKGSSPVPGAHLDLTNSDPAYLCGRLFAEYEGLQRSALGNDVNATITDRMYGKAMMSPLMVYPSLDRLAKAHLRKLRTGHHEAAATAIDRKITSLVAAIGPIPASLDVTGQARWMLGYYQQRAANIADSTAAKSARTLAATPDAAPAAATVQ